MKKDITQSPIDGLNILILTIAIFMIVTIVYATTIVSISTTDTKIIKVKYVSTSSMSIVDNCGHPMSYDVKFYTSQINLSDIYEVDIKSDMFKETITRIQLVDKEKYVEICKST